MPSSSHKATTHHYQFLDHERHQATPQGTNNPQTTGTSKLEQTDGVQHKERAKLLAIFQHRAG